MTGQQVCPDCGRTVWEAGRRMRVEGARDSDGQEAFSVWVEDILANDRRGGHQALLNDLAVRLENYCDLGTLRVPTELNHLSGELWEFKGGILRAPFYTHNAGELTTVRITYGFFKRSQKTPPREIRRGLAIMREDRLR